ncbi:MAG: 16S rRNA (guanine(966)-N(2))-methyltransferase RsmD [Alphaproteobacteria bacterium]
MRIVAGQWGGRRLQVPKGRDIRPTSDKVRGAVFNMLRGMGAVNRAVVLDAFCGSGALGLEALSQGASSCVFVDKAKSSLELARLNAAQFEAEGVSRFCYGDAAKDLVYRKYNAAFDLVFLDPPYRKSMIDSVLKNNGFLESLRDGAIIVVEVEREFQYEVDSYFEGLQEKMYGDTKVVILRYDKSAS